ncbi:ATP-dependent DNA ligase [Streptomyces albogriseolus]|uniref:ATP-dependent DNA ligase n=1 Tax=Streptomyces albogriseolus TaxID=1887 RepID=UPI00224D37D3|nr:ATP-dependent DNA ligase [Streptomyces viridodiastaticus]MCX4618003.1 ATP-dependent DNA ligase [Streptomyces viridodiastaticus]MCX4625027.1 ATP-dependent DNA ligase [Streptomyces viridodiastaticus]
MWTLPEPMLAAAAPDARLPAGWAAEVKWDGWRALLSWDAGHLVLRSRQGTQLTEAFPEVRAGAVQLPDGTALDGELVVWDESGRLAFERLQGRIQRRGAGARLAAERPAHFVAFDLLRLEGVDVTGLPYVERRAALEGLFAERGLTAPWALCPSTTDQATVDEWLTSWTAVGVEGVVFKRLQESYAPGVRAWKKHKARHTEDAIVGAYTGPVVVPRTLLLGRYDAGGRLRFVGRTTTLPQSASRALADLLTPATVHPWAGWSFSAGWGSRETLHVSLVDPLLVVEVGVDVARDSGGRWRHPARWHRARPDVAPGEVPLVE